jgi:cell division protein FtsQ
MNENRRKYDGSGTLPGMEGGSRPAPRPRIRAASPPKRDMPSWRIVAIVAAIAVGALATLYTLHELELFLIRDPRFALNGPEGDRETLEVAGAAHASQKQILAAFNEDSGRSVYLLPLTDRRATLRTVDWVKDASIMRIWPNRVVVRVSERMPVAFVELSPSRFGLIDEDGVILPPATDRFNVPVLAGVRASDPPSERRDRVRRMMKLTRELGDSSSQVSQIDVSDPDDLKVTQPFDGKMVTLLLGDRNFGLRYQNFQRNFPEIRRRLPGAATLDLRLEDRITVVQ